MGVQGAKVFNQEWERGDHQGLSKESSSGRSAKDWGGTAAAQRRIGDNCQSALSVEEWGMDRLWRSGGGTL
ncbi:hypothetical protein CRG98_042234 [Punica granatum]|uniref:Uncharacterized protein n=1 Tax=Punica granatum TaxID=22663 RepID=A0A2I0I067_PUNGR|nr:hypothetical protein CRG98_042234 [Punica granatum]